MRNMLHELKRALHSALRWLVAQDDHTSHAEDTSSHTTVWELVDSNPHSSYIPLPAGRHRIGNPDSIDLTHVVARINREWELLEQQARSRQLEQWTTDAAHRARIASYALTGHTLHNTDTGYIPRITD